ncbi:hypothetical protein FN846DRAFT_892740 [Sphaerosporella brunnea]|uniref:Uncharacterized protein n=1 Tax=Sphaerosporella brunnea TaxID=1250544 RepID=A0A5J5EPJ9_9PEZI|nr:hypothetical protein FN846DRAFT_892740 [Sphaerosporella brunnea]
MSKTKAVEGIDHLLMASEYKPLPGTMKPTKMMTDQHRLRVSPVFLDRNDVLTEKLMKMVHNAYDDLCELREGQCWPDDVRYAKLEQFVVAPVAAAFTTALVRQRGGFAEQTAAVTRQGVGFPDVRTQRKFDRQKTGCDRQSKEDKLSSRNNNKGDLVPPKGERRRKPPFVTAEPDMRGWETV